MSIRSRLGRAGGVAAAAVVIGVGSAGVSGVASAATAAPAGNPINGPVHGCVFPDGQRPLPDRGGRRGRTTDVIHTDATRIGSWEKFTVTCGH